MNLHVPALIPDDYLPDVHMRLIMYKRISNAASIAALDELKIEMIDRFGLLPDPLRSLFRTTALKLAAGAIGIARIDVGSGGGRLEFAPRHAGRCALALVPPGAGRTQHLPTPRRRPEPTPPAAYESPDRWKNARRDSSLWRDWSNG